MAACNPAWWGAPCPAALQGRPKTAQAQPLGEPLVDELLQDSFLRRLTGQFFQMLHEERTHVRPELAEQVRCGDSVPRGRAPRFVAPGWKQVLPGRQAHAPP